MCTSEVSPRDHKKIYGVTFSKSFHFTICCTFQKLLFSELNLESGMFSYPVFLHTPLLCWYLRPSSERTRRRTGQQNFALTSRDYGSINQSEKFPFPKVLTFPRFYPYHKIIDYFYFFLSYKFSIINIQF